MAQRILIVDDEDDIREFIGYNLRREGYDIYTAANGKEAVEMAVSTLPHLIILDMMMPVMDGRQACEQLRKIPELNETIIVFLSAVQEEQCQIESYLAGADDYINAIMKRLKPAIKPQCAIDSARRVVITERGEMTLPRKEFEIVELLLSNPNKVFTREEIFTAIWGGEVVVGDRTLDVHIRRLRRKLGDNTITTHKGIGFKIEV